MAGVVEGMENKGDFLRPMTDKSHRFPEHLLI